MPPAAIARSSLPPWPGRGWLAVCVVALAACHKPPAATITSDAGREQAIVSLGAGGGEGQSPNYRLRLMIGPASPVGGVPGQQVRIGPAPEALGQSAK